jgi:hypothetical protein
MSIGVGLEMAMQDKDVENMLNVVELLLQGTGMAMFLNEEVGPYIRERAQARFRNEGDDVVGKWAPLKPSTQVIRQSHPEWPVGASHPINVRTGELEQWVTQSNWNVGPNSVGASLRYPSVKPTGELRRKVTTAQRGKDYPSTVARPVLGVNPADLVFVTTRLAFYLIKRAQTI